MARANIIRTLSALGFALTLTVGLGGCDDAPEEPKQKPSELRQKVMLEKLQQLNKVEASLPLLSFNMQHNGKSIILSDDDRDRILTISDGLCNIGNTGGTKSSETYKNKVGELTSKLANLGYKTVSLKIIKGNGEPGGQRQEINIQIKNKQSSVNCSIN